MQWEEISRTAERIGTDRKNVFQEEMQKVVLTALSQSGCFNSIVFQGGTALRLFYGNPRFSEDIDLVLKEGEKGYDLSTKMPNVQRFGQHSFPFLESIDVRMQENDPELQRYVLQTLSGNPEQGLRLHIELAAVPSYQNEPRVLDFPPMHPAVRVEGASEILADKVCALALREYLKGRDLWDIYFLAHERSVALHWELVEKKIEDYRGNTTDLAGILSNAGIWVRKEGITVLENEMKRFLPSNLIEHYQTYFNNILETVIELITRSEENQGRVGT